MQRLQKIFRLVKKTGDKIIVMSENENADFLLMPLTEYEKIIDNTNDVKNLTEAELLDKINRDIALWKNAQTDDFDFGPAYYAHKDLTDENDFSDSLAEDDWDNKPWHVKFNEDDEEDLEDFMPDNLSFGQELNEKQESEIAEPESISFNSEEIKQEKPTDTPEKFLKYENIPPPPDLSSMAVMSEEKNPIIDISFNESVLTAAKTNEDDKFEEEPVY